MHLFSGNRIHIAANQMSQRSKKKSGRKRSHPNLSGYNDLVAAYKVAFPGMSYVDAITKASELWKKWKAEFGLGLLFKGYLYMKSILLLCLQH